MIPIILLIEEAEKSGRMSDEEEQQEENRSGDSPGLNNDNKYLLVWISSFPPDIIVTSRGKSLTMFLTAWSIFFSKPSGSSIIFMLVFLFSKF